LWAPALCFRLEVPKVPGVSIQAYQLAEG
jgi:hypothetical protein